MQISGVYEYNDTLTYIMQEIKLSIYGLYNIRCIIFDICYIRR